MEKQENLDEIFDLKPIIPEIYSSSHHPFSNGNTKPQICASGNTKQLKSPIHGWNSCHSQKTIIVNPSSSSSSAAAAASHVPKLLSFENSKNTDMEPSSNLDHEMNEDHSLTTEIINFSSSAKDDDQDSAKGMSQKRLSTATRTPSQALDHLMAERKRRENLTQLFISLSKVVPGLKKASLLEDGISYLKALQERVRFLEEEEIKKSSIDTSKDDYSLHKESSVDSSGITSESAAPEIQARISDKRVLVKIFCKKQTDLMSRIPCEMEKMHLNVIDIRIMPFGEAAFDITILAEMQSEFHGTVKDIVDHLHTVFLNPLMKDNNL